MAENVNTVVPFKLKSVVSGPSQEEFAFPFLGSPIGVVVADQKEYVDLAEKAGFYKHLPMVLHGLKDLENSPFGALNSGVEKYALLEFLSTTLGSFGGFTIDKGGRGRSLVGHIREFKEKNPYPSLSLKPETSLALEVAELRPGLAELKGTCVIYSTIGQLPQDISGFSQNLPIIKPRGFSIDRGSLSGYKFGKEGGTLFEKFGIEAGELRNIMKEKGNMDMYLENRLNS